MPRKYEGFLFYGHLDLSSENKGELCKKIFEDFENWGTYSNVNQIIELYNLNKLMGPEPCLPGLRECPQQRPGENGR